MSVLYRIFRKINANLELCYYIEASKSLSGSEMDTIHWLIAETFEPGNTWTMSLLDSLNTVEIGPRLTIESPFSSNAVAICHSLGIGKVTRLEYTRRYAYISAESAETILAEHLDRMTEEHFPQGIMGFSTNVVPEATREIDVIGFGIEALEQANRNYGLGMDSFDIEYYFKLFGLTLGRNPKDAELSHLGNANSEHSRHGFFKGIQKIDGVVMPQTLFDIVQRPYRELTERGENRSLLAFKDNAGVVEGFRTVLIIPKTPGKPSEMRLSIGQVIHITATAETHNHPTAVEPYNGAATGAGGRIRDQAAPGRGGIAGFGVAGYFVGNLFVPGYIIPGETIGMGKPSKYASPLQVLLRGSDGISDYGNRFGEPLILGFTRSFSQIVNDEWHEPRKPILYSAGIGHIFNEQTKKEVPEVGMVIVQIGGPAYPIGTGGGSASSMMQGTNTEKLDFDSVQRGNPEMEQKTNRVIRACVEMGKANPISSIHDQGAGGPSNVLTELVEPLGGKIDIRRINLGDKTMSVLQIWSAEFQERYGLLIRPEHLFTFQSVCERERVNCEVLGTIDGQGKIVVEDSKNGDVPVDLNLEQILTRMPQKTFESSRKPSDLKPLALPEMTIMEAIKNVFRLPEVGSKSFLVNKVDRSVTGLVAQQQCCGIAQIPIADNGVLAQSHFCLSGSVASVGEQPAMMLIDPKAGAQMAVGEALTNMASVLITDLGDVRCRANWMWPAKLPHEGARLYDAAKAMSDLMIELGIAPDGGKDSLTMAAKVSGEIVKTPGTLVILSYAPVPNIRRKITPDIKKPGESSLFLIDIGRGKNRLSGSALAKAFDQLGNESPDVDDSELLKNAFLACQEMIAENCVLAMHDRSDGGLITTVIEMCMASRCGFTIGVKSKQTAIAELFNQELGIVIEVSGGNIDRMSKICKRFGVPIEMIGITNSIDFCEINHGETSLFSEPTCHLRELWEKTSFELEKLQVDKACAEMEHRECLAPLPHIDAVPSYALTYSPNWTTSSALTNPAKPKVAVLREEGTNGDREMQAACLAGGLAPWDVTMSDLVDGRIDLDRFQGVVFAGGFSYMDVFGSAKGWAGKILFNEKLRDMFQKFRNRRNTFSLGVCNGCQLMTHLGWTSTEEVKMASRPRFIGNTSGRFESRWVQVEILSSPSILLSGMESSKLGIWVAHGEGRLIYPDESIQRFPQMAGVPAMAFIDPWGNPTETYPYNPNGSPRGITALCSSDGRHLAMMPHPERCFRLWQWPWVSPSWGDLDVSPWLTMFQNATRWCMEH